MEHQSGCRRGVVAVKAVADDWCVKSVGMGGVYAKLVCASGVGIKPDDGLVVADVAFHVVVGQCFETVDGVHFLVGTPVDVGD